MSREQMPDGTIIECDEHGDLSLYLRGDEDEQHGPSPDPEGLPEVVTNGQGRTSGLRITRASDVRVEAVEFLLPDRVPLGALTLLAGDPGLGKSTWSCRLAAGVTAGEYGLPATVLIANAEDSPSHVTVPRLAAAGADLHRVEFFSSTDTTTTVGERPFELPGDVARLEAHAKRVGARLVVIDPLNAHLGDDVSTKSDHSVRRALAPLAGMAQRLGIAVVVVAHLNKAQGTDAIYRVGGSIGLVGGARSLLVFTRDPDDPDGEDGDRRALGHAKSNWARLAPTLSYVHQTATVTVGGATVETNRLMALGESGVAGTALLGAAGDDSPSSQHERAEELIADMLGDGQRRRAKEIKDAARKQGIPERTVQRAAHDAEVSMESEGFPRVTYWQLSQSRHALGATVDGATGATGESSANTADFDHGRSQSRQTQMNGATGAGGRSDRAPERAEDNLVTGGQSPLCRCDRPVPVPDHDADALRCALCGRLGDMGTPEGAA